MDFFIGLALVTSLFANFVMGILLGSNFVAHWATFKQLEMKKEIEKAKSLDRFLKDNNAA